MVASEHIRSLTRGGGVGKPLSNGMSLFQIGPDRSYGNRDVPTKRNVRYSFLVSTEMFAALVVMLEQC